jgi:hypothetical protein
MVEAKWATSAHNSLKGNETMDETKEFKKGHLSHKKTPDEFPVQGTITPTGGRRCKGEFRKPPDFPLLANLYDWYLWIEDDDIGKLEFIPDINNGSTPPAHHDDAVFSFVADLVEPAH